MKTTITVCLFVSLLGSCARTEPLPLPSIGADGDCDAAAVPTVCEWQDAADWVGYGEVSSVTLADDPVVSNNEPVGSCSGSIDPALVIALSGAITLAGEEHTAVSFRIGAAVAGQMCPRPVAGEEGVDWVGSCEGAIAVGQVLGAALVEVDEQFSLAGNRLFSVIEESATFQSATGDCVPAQPSSFESPVALDDVVAENCDDGVGDARRTAMLAEWGTPSRALAAVCNEAAE